MYFVYVVYVDLKTTWHRRIELKKNKKNQKIGNEKNVNVLKSEEDGKACQVHFNWWKYDFDLW